MTKYAFLNELEQLLSGLDADERREILEDYEEHFAFAKRANKSDAQVIELVGTPKTVAEEILGGDNDSNVANMSQKATTLKELEAKLSAKAEELNQQATRLEEQLATQKQALNNQDKDNLETFVDSAVAFAETMVGQAGAFAQNIAETVSETLTETMDDLSLTNEVESETLIEEIVDVSAVKKVIINARNQKINIKKTYDETAKVRLTKGMLSVKVEDEILYIESRELKRNFRNWFSVSVATPAILEVQLPDVTYNLIQAKTINARLEFSNIAAEQLDINTTNSKIHGNTIKGQINVGTNNGTIEITNLAGNIEAKTINGGIKLTEITGNVEAKTTNGGISLSNITGNIGAKTTNGRIKFDNNTIKQNVELRTTNGKIVTDLLTKPENAKFELSTSNSKTVLFGTNRNYEIFGDGAYEVKLSTSNAKIEVSQKE